MKQTQKYGIEIPRDVAHAKELDRINSNTLWMHALKKEMYNVGVAFEVLEEGVRAPNGWTKVTSHLVWDVKMDFTRKARWVLDGHKTPEKPKSLQCCISHISIRKRALVLSDHSEQPPDTHLHCNRSLPSWTILAVLWQMFHVSITDWIVSGSIKVTNRPRYTKEKSTILHVFRGFMAALPCLEHLQDVC